MSDTDARRAQHEASELDRMVDELFSDPTQASPRLVSTGGRAQLLIWRRPSFEQHVCWATWGAGPKDKPASDMGLARRLTWRREIDMEGRADPIGRLKRLGDKLEPTLEVADGQISVGDFAIRMASFPALGPTTELLQHPGALMLDGAHFGIEIDTGLSLIRVQWSGSGGDWTPSDSTFDLFAEWASAFTNWLDQRLGP